MKITSIETGNFLGARAVNVALTKPVCLFAGKNGAGKSSLSEAVRMALAGESVRVDLKKDYGKLLSDDGAESGFVSVLWEGGEASIVLPKGDRHVAGANQSLHGALPYVLDAQRFASLADNDRRAFLFALMNLKTDGESVTKRMLAKGCDAKKVELITPILRAGFEAGQKEAQAKAREAKSAWKTVTGGETYGEKKAEGWKAESAAVDPAAIATAEKALADIDTAIGEANQRLGALQGAASSVAGRAARMTELTETAGKYARIQEKLHRDENELAEWEKKVVETRAKAGGTALDTAAPGQFLLRGLACVTDEFLTIASNHPEYFVGDLVNRASTHLAEYKKLHGWPHKKEGAPDPEAVAALPSHEKALSLLQSAVANGKRDLAAADAAAVALKEFEAQAAEAPNEGAILEAKSKVETLKNERKGAHTRLDDLRAAMRKAAEATSKTKLAAGHHADVQAWDKVASALAPDGIPGEILAEALGPINARLQAASADTEWEQAVIHPDMRITYGKRDYALISESEKWRVDAMIAEAVSFLSGVKLVVLDRFDVLDAKGREDLLIWLDILAQDKEIDSAIIFGTLKALPAGLPNEIQAVWIENGTAGQLKEAA